MNLDERLKHIDAFLDRLPTTNFLVGLTATSFYAGLMLLFALLWLVGGK